MLKDIFKDHKAWIIFTYSITVLEFALFAFLPYLLGKAIDSLLADNTEDFVFYIGCSVAGLIVGFVRRRMDTRVFMSIWRIKAIDTINSLIGRGVPTAKLFSRSQLVKRYPDFFEFTIPLMVSATMEIAIASVMICLVVFWTGLIVTGLAILAVASSWLFSLLIRRIENRMQLIRERRDKALSERNMAAVEEEYVHLTKDWIKYSDLDAYCWGVCDLLGIVATVFLTLAVVEADASIGMILASVTYCVKMFERSGFMAYFFNHIQELAVFKEFLEGD